MNNKNISDADQAITYLANTLPEMYGNLYAKLKDAGFDKDQSWTLLLMMIEAMNGSSKGKK